MFNTKFLNAFLLPFFLCIYFIQAPVYASSAYGSLDNLFPVNIPYSLDISSFSFAEKDSSFSSLFLLSGFGDGDMTDPTPTPTPTPDSDPSLDPDLDFGAISEQLVGVHDVLLNIEGLFSFSLAVQSFIAALLFVVIFSIIWGHR